MAERCGSARAVRGDDAIDALGLCANGGPIALEPFIVRNTNIARLAFDDIEAQGRRVVGPFADSVHHQRFAFFAAQVERNGDHAGRPAVGRP